MRKSVFVMLAAGMAASLGAGGCIDILYFYPNCYDEFTKTWICCDSRYPDEPICMGDAGVDGEADAGTDADASPTGEGDASADDAGPPGVVCPWACTPVGGAGFDPFPSYVWIGEESDVPPPAPAPAPQALKFTSWIDVDLTGPSCPTCSCIAPTNSNDGCVLPTVWNVESTVCQELSSPSVTSFDPPANWAGSCTSTNPIDAGISCDGEPCVKSLVLQPPTVAPCVAESVMSPGGQPVDLLDQKQVIEYVSSSQGPPCSSTSNCIAPPPTNYKLCLVANDIDVVVSCPDGWTEQYVGWRHVIDTRVCSACTCGSPEGAYCEVRASVYSDETCGNERGSIVLPSNEDAKCVDLPVGTALGSKTAEIISYQAGTCAPSKSEIVGTLELQRPVTYCCVPSLPTIP